MTWRTTAAIWIVVFALFYALGKLAHGAEGPYTVSYSAPPYEMSRGQIWEGWCINKGTQLIDCYLSRKVADDVAATFNKVHEARTTKSMDIEEKVDLLSIRVAKLADELFLLKGRHELQTLKDSGCTESQ